MPCRTCWFCTHGEPWLCSAIEGLTGTPGGLLADGTPFEACLGLGAMAEEVVCPATAVVPLPDDVPLEEAALLGCAILTGVGAAQNAAQVQPGETVLVVGLGGVGLSAVTGARLAGAERIIAVDTSAAKETLARAAGATDFLLADPTLAKQVRAMTEGRGVDKALECVGSATTIRTAWTAVRRGGTCVVVGVGPRDQQVTFNPLELFHFSRTLTSSIYGNSDPERDIPALVDHLRAGRLDLAGTDHRPDRARRRPGRLRRGCVVARAAARSSSSRGPERPVQSSAKHEPHSARAKSRGPRPCPPDTAAAFLTPGSASTGLAADQVSTLERVSARGEWHRRATQMPGYDGVRSRGVGRRGECARLGVPVIPWPARAIDAEPENFPRA